MRSRAPSAGATWTAELDAAIVAASMVYVTRLPGGTLLVFAIAAAFSALMFRAQHNSHTASEPVLVSARP